MIPQRPEIARLSQNFIPKIYPSVLHFAKQLKIEIFLALMKIHQGSEIEPKNFIFTPKKFICTSGPFLKFVSFWKMIQKFSRIALNHIHKLKIHSFTVIQKLKIQNFYIQQRNGPKVVNTWAIKDFWAIFCKFESKSILYNFGHSVFTIK